VSKIPASSAAHLLSRLLSCPIHPPAPVTGPAARRSGGPPPHPLILVPGRTPNGRRRAQEDPRAGRYARPRCGGRPNHGKLANGILEAGAAEQGGAKAAFGERGTQALCCVERQRGDADDELSGACAELQLLDSMGSRPAEEMSAGAAPGLPPGRLLLCRHRRRYYSSSWLGFCRKLATLTHPLRSPPVLRGSDEARVRGTGTPATRSSTSSSTATAGSSAST
jgi:hypothetical protein